MVTEIGGAAGLVVEVRRGTLAGIAAARVERRCLHGTARAFVLLVDDERRNREAIEVALRRQIHTAGCRCNWQQTPLS